MTKHTQDPKDAPSPSTGSRWPQLLLIATFLPLCWLGMMVVHEFGHVVGAWLTGGTVAKVVLHPLAISRTDVWPNPHPLPVVAAGPVLGSLFPLLAWGLAGCLRLPGRYLWRFFAGFCLIANGAYLGFGSFDGVGDAGDLLREGAGEWQLWLFGAATIPAGLYLWHRQGRYFGLGPAGGRVSIGAAWCCLLLLGLVVALELALDGG